MSETPSNHISCKIDPDLVQWLKDIGLEEETIDKVIF